MCHLFVGADQRLWDSTARTFNIDNTALTLQIENFYWGILDRIARRDSLTIEELLNTLYFEAIDADHTKGSFTSFLRVCCGRFLDLLHKGEIPDNDTPIRDLDAEAILARENTPGLRLVHGARKGK